MTLTDTKHCRCNRAKTHAWNCGLLMDETRGIVGHDQSAAGVIALKDTSGIVGK